MNSDVSARSGGALQRTRARIWGTGHIDSGLIHRLDCSPYHKFILLNGCFNQIVGIDY